MRNLGYNSEFIKGSSGAFFPTEVYESIFSLMCSWYAQVLCTRNPLQLINALFTHEDCTLYESK